MTYAPNAAASDARSEAAGDAGTSSRPSDNADEAAPPAPEGLVGSPESYLHGNRSPPAYVTVITKGSTKEDMSQVAGFAQGDKRRRIRMHFLNCDPAAMQFA